MKRILISVAVVLTGQLAFGMVGGPLFCVGQQMTSMTVEASKVNLDVSAPSGDEREDAVSDRVLLTARYGLAPCLDISGSVGTANLNFNGLSGGYNDFDASWSLAWGASLRAGAPIHPRRF